MTLIKTSVLNGIAVSIKMITMLVLNKILAIYVGPAGYAIVGQFQNAIQMITTIASGAINTGVVKYTSEFYDDEKNQIKIWKTAGSIAIIGTIATSVILILFNSFFTKLIFQNEDFGSILIWLSLTLVFFVFNTLLISILNGKKEINKYIIINIAGSLFSIAISGFLIVKFGLYGALLSLAINQSLVFFVTLAMTYRTTWFKLSNMFGKLDKDISINLGKYTLMALSSAIIAPINYIFIRSHIGETLGLEAAGLWEAMWRLSAAYLMFVTTVLSVYYIPRLSELKISSEIKKEIHYGSKIIIPITIVLSLTVFLLKDFITILLFTEEFLEMRVMFGWQMLGDTLKISSYLLSFLMLAKAMTKLMIISQIVFHSSFYVLVVLCTNFYGLEGAAIAHFINYIIYIIFCYFFIYRKV